MRAICIITNPASDAVVVPQGWNNWPAAEPLLSVTGDGAYDTQLKYVAVMERNAMPVIAPAKECADVQRQCLCTSQCGDCRMQAFGMQVMEEMKWLSPQKLGADQDALHQATRRADDVSHLRACKSKSRISEPPHSIRLLN